MRKSFGLDKSPKTEGIRLKLLMIGAIVRATHRRFRVQRSGAYRFNPQDWLEDVLSRIATHPAKRIDDFIALRMS